MNIKLYSFTKRKNSTKIPTGGAIYTGTLKSNTSVVSPSIIFEFSAFPAYNYAYIQEFSRYYWITDKVQIANNVWQIDMKVDVLASYKTEIGDSSKYVLRSAVAYDGAITDLKYPTKTDVKFKRQTVAPFNNYTYATTYILGVVSPSTVPTNGAVTYFIMSDAEMMSLRSNLMTGANSYFGGITDPDIQNFALLLGNPMQYIKSCRAFPFELTSLYSTDLVLGNTNCGSKRVLNYNSISDTKNIIFNGHPQINRGIYMNAEPFTQRYIYWSPIGLVHLPSVLIGQNTMGVLNFTLDLISGIGRMTFETDHLSTPTDTDEGILFQSDFQLGYDVPLAQVVSGDPIKLVSATTNVLGAGLSALTGNIAGAIQGGVSAIGDFMSASVPQMTGYLAGSGSTLRPSALDLMDAFYLCADMNVSEYGRPLMQTVTINTLSGYVLCADGELETDGTEPEITELESFLTGGFFYE